MKKYYCVTSSFKDNGNAFASITDCVSADKKPENSFKSTRSADIYNDWFDSYDEAKQFVKSVANA